MIPLNIFFCGCLKYFVSKYGMPKYNKRKLIIGWGLLLIAVIFFVLGIDKDKDYIRWKHGMWHLFIGFSLHLIWQV